MSDIESGRPIETENADHSQDSKLTKPAPMGGHSWHPMAYNSATGLVYIPAMNNQAQYSTDTNFEYRPGGHWNLAQAPGGFGLAVSESLIRGVVRRIMTGYLQAWDPVQQAWALPNQPSGSSEVVSGRMQG